MNFFFTLVCRFPHKKSLLQYRRNPRSSTSMNWVESFQYNFINTQNDHTVVLSLYTVFIYRLAQFQLLSSTSFLFSAIQCFFFNLLWWTVLQKKHTIEKKDCFSSQFTSHNTYWNQKNQPNKSSKGTVHCHYRSFHLYNVPKYLFLLSFRQTFQFHFVCLVFSVHCFVLLMTQYLIKATNESFQISVGISNPKWMDRVCCYVRNKNIAMIKNCLVSEKCKLSGKFLC